MPTVKINANGELVIYEGVSIVGAGNITNAGVDVTGRFTMKGGEMYGHRRLATGGSGAALYIHNNGTFQMDGGKIYNNKADYGGGMFIATGGVFIMNGGEMYDNHTVAAGDAGGAVSAYGDCKIEINPGAVIYGKDGGGGKTGNTGTDGKYGHAISVWFAAGGGKGRNATIQNETLSTTWVSGAETKTSGNWDTTF
jgi:hypothetical protein